MQTHIKGNIYTAQADTIGGCRSTRQIINKCRLIDSHSNTIVYYLDLLSELVQVKCNAVMTIWRLADLPDMVRRISFGATAGKYKLMLYKRPLSVALHISIYSARHK